MKRDACNFSEVFEAERRLITERRLAAGKTAGDLFGLAFSGGGIRSATFNLGVLQALAERKLLSQVDYLSTVSGGGYIGSWLSAWILRRDGDVGAVEEELARSAGSGMDEPAEVRFLRRFSNYLTPRIGVFSTDTLAAVATYLRNMLLNLVILIAMFAALLVVPMLVGMLAHTGTTIWMPIGVAGFVVALLFINLNLEHRSLPREGGTPWYMRPGGVFWVILVPLLLTAHTLGMAMVSQPAPTLPDMLAAYVIPAFGVCLLAQVTTWLIRVIADARPAEEANAVAKGFVPALKGLVQQKVPGKPLEYHYGIADLFRILLGFVVAVLLGILGLWMYRILPFLDDQSPGRLWHATVLSLPVGLMVFGLATIFHIGISGRTFSEETREWWARLGGRVLGLAVAWLAFFGTAIYGPYLMAKLGHWIGGLGTAWLLSTVAGLWVGRSQFTGGVDQKRWMEWIGRIAPYVFIAGLLLLLSWALFQGLSASAKVGAGAVRQWYFAEYAQALNTIADPAHAWLLLGVCAAFLGVALGMARAVDVNVFSFHMFYRNRLVRCFLGASNQERDPHPFTGFDPGDAPKVSDLAQQRPYHIVNTALNLTRETDLAWQERNAASFVISPLYCGYQLPAPESDVVCYQPTANYLSPPGKDGQRQRLGWLSLGTALTISGAAASPNMGYHSSRPLAFLMTVFNVRLGWWMQNTRRDSDWTRPGPRFGLWWLLRELSGSTGADASFVYLSDGGHFENLGVYELVRRRCRLIIVSDVGHDPLYQMEDLANAVRKCHVDLGVRIRIDTHAIVPDPKTGRSQFHCAVGKIQYGDSQDDASDGLLVYIKPSLTGNEPADISNYAAVHPQFPHQPTSDQWFDESQFESYRNLGNHILGTVLDGAGRQDDVESLFVALKQRWYPPSASVAASFTRHGDQLKLIEDTLRRDPYLRFMDAQIVPEWGRLMAGLAGVPPTVLSLPQSSEEVRAGFYLCASMLQLMENVYLDLNLEEEYDRPDNRGWMNLFKHWSWSGMFLATYSICCSMTGARFQRWCARRLPLLPGKIELQKKPWRRQSEPLDSLLAGLEASGDLNFVEAQIIREEVQADASFDAIVLLQMVCSFDPPITGSGSGELLRYTFGFALVEADAITYFRIQDHLRKMGLARRSLRLMRDAGFTKLRLRGNNRHTRYFEALFNSIGKSDQPASGAV